MEEDGPLVHLQSNTWFLLVFVRGKGRIFIKKIEERW